MFFYMAEYCDTPESKDRRNGENKPCLNERAILRLLDHDVTGQSRCFSAHEKGSEASVCRRILDYRWIACYAPNQSPFIPSVLPLNKEVIQNGSGCNCLLSNKDRLNVTRSY
jgi:hypothetical protein